MSYQDTQPPESEDLSTEKLRLQKAQQTIDCLLKAANQNETLKRQLEAVTSVESLVEIAVHQGYELTVADIETLRHHRQQPVQLYPDDLDDNELSEQDLELVAGGSGFIALNASFTFVSLLGK